MNRPDNIVQFPNGGGLQVPEHVLRDREAQKQAFAELAQAAYQRAYEEAVGPLLALAKGVDRQVGVAAQLLQALIQNPSATMNIHQYREATEAQAAVESAFNLANAFIAHASLAVDRLKAEARAKLEELNQQTQARLVTEDELQAEQMPEPMPQAQDEQLARFDADQESVDG